MRCAAWMMMLAVAGAWTLACGDDGGADSDGSGGGSTGATSTSSASTGTGTSGTSAGTTSTTTDATAGTTSSGTVTSGSSSSETAAGSSSGGMGTSSGATEGGTGAAACEPTNDDGECFTCVKPACCSQWTQCQNDENCACIVECHVVDGNSLGNCRSTCGDSELYNGVYFCGQANCLGLCDWQSP